MAEGNENKESKTEEATPHKREELRRKGQVAQSREIGNATILLGVSIFFYFYSSNFIEQLASITKSIFLRIDSFSINDANIISLFLETITTVATIVAPIFIICLIISVFTGFFQTGVIFTSETIKFNLNKINPVNGFQRLFSLKSIVETIKAIVKLSIISSIVYMVIKGELEGSIALADQTIEQTIIFVAKALFKTLMYISFLMLALAVLDYLYQRLKFESDIKMTKHEVREELKDREGDPNIKARIRSLQRKMATKRMIDDVPKAQVVITNPTHLAVAIRYEKDMAAPKVVAKGADYLAEKIRKLAKENNIPLVENKELAKTLYKNVKVGHYIPENLYNAVAEVLVFVMRMKNDFANIFTKKDGNGLMEGLSST